MRYFTLILTIIAVAIAADPEPQIAAATAAIAINRLAADADDQGARTLLRAALIMDRDCQAALLAVGMLDRGLALEAVEAPVAPDRLCQGMLRRGAQLLRANDQLPLALLYARLAEQHSPRDRDVILLLSRLEMAGQAATLEQLLDRGPSISPQRFAAAYKDEHLAKRAMVAVEDAVVIGDTRLALLPCRDYDHAVEVAGILGGRMARLNSPQLHQAAVDLCGAPQAKAFFGLTRTEDKWRWSDGAALGPFTRWAPGQPNDHGGNQDVVILWQGTWWDVPRNYTKSFLCEWPVN